MFNKRTAATLGLSFVLAASPLALVACGSTSSDTETEAATTEEASDTTSSSSSSSDTAATYSISADEVTEAYMGVSEAGETVYYIGNSDGSKTGIFFLDADNMAHVSFMGKATVTQQNGESLITITDELSGNTITFSVVGNDDGTVTIDMGSELGKAILAECEPSEAIDAIQTIQGYTDQIA
ncbi:MAG: hypothetical protein ACI361_08180 [Atopobiaceae bacterium]